MMGDKANFTKNGNNDFDFGVRVKRDVGCRIDEQTSNMPKISK